MADSTDTLKRALDTMDHGMVVLDANLIILQSNGRAAELLEVPADWLKPGRTFKRIIGHAAKRGDYGAGAKAKQIRKFTELARGRRSHAFERIRPDGTTIEVRGKPIHGGGLVVTYTDITKRKRAELALSHSETRLRNIVDGSIQGICIIDRNWKIIFANKAFATIFGYRSPREVTALDAAFEFVAPEDRQRIRSIAGTRFKGGSAPTRYEFRGIRKDRRKLWLQIQSHVVEWDGGPAIQASVIDISEQKQWEEALLKKSSYLENILDNIDQGISLIDKDLNAVAFNRRFLDLLEFPPNRFRNGDPFEKFVRYNAQRGEYGPGDIDTLVAERVALAQKFEAHRFERQRPDGTVLEIRGNPVPGGGFVTTYTDMTARKQAEDTIREAEERFRTLVSNAPEALVLFDAETGTLVEVNEEAERLFGLPRKKLLRLGPADLSPPSQPNGRASDQAAAEFIEMTLNGEVPVFEWLHKNAKGDLIPCEVRLVQMRVGDQCLVRGSIIDITERKRHVAALLEAKEQAEMANKAKSDFLATMSHELRTPLNAIIGFSDLIRNKTFGPVQNERYAGYVDNIHDSGCHLLEIINDLLDMAKVESGQIELHEELVDIPDLLTTVCRLIKGRAADAGIAIKISNARNLPWLRADPRLIRQIMFNLLGNAIKFTPKGGTISVRSKLNARNELAVTVTDTGIGISKHDLERVFEPFQQVDSVLVRKYDGTGLGLPLAKSLADLHDADLTLASRPSSGTTATLTFPSERLVVDADHNPERLRA